MALPIENAAKALTTKDWEVFEARWARGRSKLPWRQRREDAVYNKLARLRREGEHRA